MDLIQILNGTLVIETLERWLSDEDGDWVGFSSPEHVATFSALAILITATNGPLVYVLLKQATKTFIDWLIITDCVLCILNIVMMTLMSALKFVMLENVLVCYMMFGNTYLTYCNKLLTLGIVICRYVFVLHSSLVETERQRKTFIVSILTLIFFVPFVMTCAAVLYSDNAYLFLSKIKSIKCRLFQVKVVGRLR